MVSLAPFTLIILTPSGSRRAGEVSDKTSGRCALGGPVSYADQDSQGPLELRVYAGVDGQFELYDDAGDSYAYERGERAVTPLAWSDGGRKLTIGARVGTFQGMAGERTFKVVLIDGGRERVKTVRYDGGPLTVAF